MLFERTPPAFRWQGFPQRFARDSRVPEKHRQEAHRLLCLYPSQEEVVSAGTMQERICEDTLRMPSFSSTLEQGTRENPLSTLLRKRAG